jgi:hypothetical protein
MGIVMQVSFTASLDTERAQYTIGRVTARAPWRGADPEAELLDREIALRGLVREAEEYGAHGIVEVAYAVEECAAGECDGVKLRRVVATGRAVRLSLAA